MNKAVSFMLVGILASVVATTAGAVTFGFDRITSNSAIDAASQFSLDVTDGGTHALFDFNVAAGAQDPNVAEIYFDVRNGLLLAPIAVASNVGTSFSPLNNLAPGNLPGGSSIGFTTITGLGIDSDVSGPPKDRPFPSSDGLNVGDTLILSIGFGGGVNFADVIAALNNGQIRVGMHVRSLAGGESDGFVTRPNPPTNPIPLPAAGWMLLAGVGGLAAWGRRRRNAA